VEGEGRERGGKERGEGKGFAGQTASYAPALALNVARWLLPAFGS